MKIFQIYKQYRGDRWCESTPQNLDVTDGFLSKVVQSESVDKIREYCEKISQPYIDDAIEKYNGFLQNALENITKSQQTINVLSALPEEQRKLTKKLITDTETELQYYRDMKDNFEQAIESIKSNPYGCRGEYVTFRYTFEELEIETI